MNYNHIQDRLEEIKNILLNIDVDIVREKINGKWSKQEILGHLIDSASNNHKRFVMAQFKEDMIFDGYDQDDWVSVQKYNELDWNLLIDLWFSFNTLIIHICKKIPEETLLKPRNNHNLDRIAWKKVPADRPTTLKYFIEDYFGHLEHHIAQIAS